MWNLIHIYMGSTGVCHLDSNKPVLLTINMRNKLVFHHSEMRWDPLGYELFQRIGQDIVRDVNLSKDVTNEWVIL